MVAEHDRPVRVLVIDHTAPVRSVRSRWDRLVERGGYELTILSPERWIENSAVVEFQRTGDEPYRVVLGRIVNIGDAVKSFYLRGMGRAFREARPDVVIMMEEAFSLVAMQAWLMRQRFSPRAPMSFYACWILPYADMYYRPRFAFRWLYRTMLRRLNAGMCINERATQELRRAGYPNARTNFFGIDEALFVPIDRSLARERLGFASDERIFLFAGRLIELKGVHYLITAFSRIAQRRAGDRLRLVILGAGDYEESLRELAATSAVPHRVEFCGAVPNELVRTYMCAADAFVLPSREAWHEQFGRVLAEAMLVGTTVVGSTSGEIPTVIGDGGFIFRADDVDHLAEVLERVLDDDEEVARRIAIGRDIAHDRYSVAAFVERTATLIDELSGRVPMTEATIE